MTQHNIHTTKHNITNRQSKVPEPPNNGNKQNNIDIWEGGQQSAVRRCCRGDTRGYLVCWFDKNEGRYSHAPMSTEKLRQPDLLGVQASGLYGPAMIFQLIANLEIIQQLTAESIIWWLSSIQAISSDETLF